MSASGPRSAVVSAAALDLRSRPDHRAEMRSQLLLGEVVDRVRVTPDGLWWLVRNRSDDYQGWVRKWGLVAAVAGRAGRWVRLARGRVVVPSTLVTSHPGRGAGVSPLFLNARVIPGRRSGPYRRIERPDGRRGWAPSVAIEAGDRPPPPLARRIRSLLGSPYLWGGRTPAGYDCSGYVQQVLAEQGIALPRDAWRQRGACRVIGNGSGLREGDLLFFGPPRGRVSHVGLAVGGGYFTDCRGRVRMVSIEPGNPLYDKALMAQLRAYGRPPERTR